MTSVLPETRLEWVVVSVREAAESDAAQLLELMKALSRYEGYSDQFAVTERDLLDRGLGRLGCGQFVAFVAESDPGQLLGYAVTYEIPFTYDLLPTLVLKELFVAEAVRGRDIGRALMGKVIDQARHRQCPRLKWEVLPGNERAKSFYRLFGARPIHEWEAWALAVSG